MAIWEKLSFRSKTRKGKKEREKSSGDRERSNKLLDGLMLTLQSRVTDERKKAIEQAKILDSMENQPQTEQEQKVAALPSEDKETPNINLQKSEQFLFWVTVLQDNLTKSNVLRLKVDEIDSNLQAIADKMDSAMKANKPKTANEAMEALMWGIIKGRAELEKSEANETANIIDYRREVLENYRNTIESAEEIDDTRKKLLSVQKERGKEAKELEKIISEIDKIGRKTVGGIIPGHDNNGIADELAKKVKALKVKRDTADELIKTLDDNIESLEDKILNLEKGYKSMRCARLALQCKKRDDLYKKMNEAAMATMTALAERHDEIAKLVSSVALLISALNSYTKPVEQQLEEEKAHLSYLEWEQREQKQSQKAEEQKHKHEMQENKQLIAN